MPVNSGGSLGNFRNLRIQGDEDLWGLGVGKLFSGSRGWPMSDNDIFQMVSDPRGHYAFSDWETFEYLSLPNSTDPTPAESRCSPLPRLKEDMMTVFKSYQSAGHSKRAIIHAFKLLTLKTSNCGQKNVWESSQMGKVPLHDSEVCILYYLILSLWFIRLHYINKKQSEYTGYSLEWCTFK